jgi:predicted acylesterase/phospholipase RssA
LDATTAVPVLFPPVKIGEYLHIDGGTISNIPETIAYIVSKSKFPEEDIRMLSLGINVTIETLEQLSSSTFDHEHVGIVQLLAIGFPMSTMSRNPLLSNQLVTSLLADKFLRIEGIIKGDTDDLTVIKKCKDICDDIWKKEESKIRKFINSINPTTDETQ